MKMVKCGAALLIALVIVLMPAAAIQTQNTGPVFTSLDAHRLPVHSPGPLGSRTVNLITIALGLGIAGSVTVTYSIRGGGLVPVRILASTTGPTANQAAQVQKQSALIAFGADADTQALFTHNWGLDASAPGYYEPEVCTAWVAIPATLCGLSFDWSNTNVLKVNKANAAGSISTVLVTIRRPHSIGQ